MKIGRERGVVINVVGQYETLVGEEWQAVVRYDCAHGFFHRDVLMPNDDKEKKAIDLPDLEVALSYAEQDLQDR
jgi:hypothetical protein